ncbi:group 1 truncated hemoglobin [Myxococcota bacterium]|nr:group 1 truncated hemoglobin [Myxococcota bacterium]
MTKPPFFQTFFAKIIPLVAALFLVSLWSTGCPAPTNNEQATETTTEKVADGSTESTPEATAEKQAEATPETQAEATPETQVEATPEATGSLYQRLGEEAGIQKVVGNFVERVVKDTKINGYFLNSTLDSTRFTGCLVKQIGQATGGPQKYDCKGMKETHQGMGVSKQDFTDLVGHLVDALKEAKVAQADIDAIAAVLTPMEKDIVEDADNNKTFYQRVGRRPAIEVVIADFLKRVLADTTISTFFANTLNTTRLNTCLVRLVCNVDGPCQYGKEPSFGELGPDDKKPCLSMANAHKGLGISHQDFTTLVGHLVDALKAAKVAQADIDSFSKGVVGTVCPDIVEVGKDQCAKP